MKNTTATPDRTKSFSDLIAWQKARRLVVKIYLLTKNILEDEKFGLASQSVEVRKLIFGMTKATLNRNSK